MKSDVKVKMIYGNKEDKLRQLKEFQKSHRVIKVLYGDVMIVKYSLGQVNFDDLEEIIGEGTPFEE